MSARAESRSGRGRSDRERSCLDDTARSSLRDSFLHELSHDERLLLLLRYAEGMSVAEVALALNISHDDVVATQERLVSQMSNRLRAA